LARFPRLLILYLKQRYSATFGMLLIAVTIIYIVSSIGLMSRGDPSEIIRSTAFTLSLFLAIYLPFTTVFPQASTMLRSEVDFLMTTQFSAMGMVAMMLIGNGLLPAALMMTYSIPPLYLSKDPLHTTYSALSILALSVIIIEGEICLQWLPFWLRIIAVASSTLYLVVTSTLYSWINPIYLALSPSPLVLITYLALFVALTLVVPKRLAQELYTNAYGFLSLIPATISSANITGSRLPRSSSALVLYTSINAPIVFRLSGLGGAVYDVRRINVIKLLLPVSAASPLGFWVGFRVANSDLASVATALFLLLLYSILFLGSSVSTTRLWVDFVNANVNVMHYLRIRMMARLVLTYVIYLPWIITMIVLHMVTHSAVLMLSAVVLIIAPPLLVTSSWIIAALSGLPQIKEPLETRPYRFTVRNALLIGGALLMVGLLVSPIIAIAASQLLPQGLQQVSSLASLLLLILNAAISIGSYIAMLYMGYAERIWLWIIEYLITRNNYS